MNYNEKWPVLQLKYEDNIPINEIIFLIIPYKIWQTEDELSPLSSGKIKLISITNINNDDNHDHLFQFLR